MISAVIALLPGFVVTKPQIGDQVASILRGCVHGHHARGILRSQRFEECLVDLKADQPRQERAQQFLRFGLIQVLAQVARTPRLGHTGSS